MLCFVQHDKPRLSCHETWSHPYKPDKPLLNRGRPAYNHARCCTTNDQADLGLKMSNDSLMTRDIGVISDTHGLLREQVKSRLQGCEMIIHAGDIGGPSVLTELRQIAEVVAVRGNVDQGRWARELNLAEYLEIDGASICVIHDIGTLDLDPAGAGVNVVIYGHSHKPTIERKDGILYLNPGSAGPQRFQLPVSIALLHVETQGVLPEIVEL